MDPQVPLVVPEINPGQAAIRPKGIIAVPNCTTLSLIVPMAALHRAFGLRELVVASYQAASGAGQAGVEALYDQLGKVSGNRAIGQRAGDLRGVLGDLRPFTAPLVLNVVPWAGSLRDEGWSSEELKIRDESRKILGMPDLKVSATCVRVPVVTTHSVAVHAVFDRDVTRGEAQRVLSGTPGVVLLDDPAGAEYPTPADVVGTDPTWVGRVRQSMDDPAALDLLITGYEQVRGQRPVPGRAHLGMDMRGPHRAPVHRPQQLPASAVYRHRVAGRPDCPDEIRAVIAGHQQRPEVPGGLRLILDVIQAEVVGLPDVDRGAGHRPAGRTGDRAAQHRPAATIPFGAGGDDRAHLARRGSGVERPLDRARRAGPVVAQLVDERGQREYVGQQDELVPVAGAELAGPGQEVEAVPPLIRRRPGFPDERVQMPDTRGQQLASARAVGPHLIKSPVGEAARRRLPCRSVRHGLLLPAAAARAGRACLG